MRINARHPYLICLCLLAGSCGAPEAQFSGGAYSRLHADFVAPGSHRLVQVVDLAERGRLKEFIVGTKPVSSTYDSLIAAGIAAHEITDGSVAAAITTCCGGKITEESIILFYTPPDLPIEVGDVVEVKVGESPDLGPAARPNTAVRVRARGEDQGDCKWLPNDPGLWMRVLYCKGIEQEGWTKSDDSPSWWTLPPGR